MIQIPTTVGYWRCVNKMSTAYRIQIEEISVFSRFLANRKCEKWNKGDISLWTISIIG